jgi:hypothetical protein
MSVAVGLLTSVSTEIHCSVGDQDRIHRHAETCRSLRARQNATAGVLSALSCTRGTLDPNMQVRKRFEAAGGEVFQFTAAEAAHVHPNGIALQLPPNAPGSGNGSSNGSSSPTEQQEPITGRLLVDCMVLCLCLKVSVV